MRLRDRALPLIGWTLCLTVGCQSDQTRLIEAIKLRTQGPPPSQEWHQGPDVAIDGTGPARYVPALFRFFDAERAMETVAFTDRFYRAPGNDGYEEVLGHLRERLRAAGWDDSDSRLELREIETEMGSPAWTPRSASLELLTPGVGAMELHGFDSEEQVDRTMLPLGAPSCDVTGPICLSMDALEAGDIFVTQAAIGQVAKRAKQRGAAAVISASLAPFNVDPTGRERHLDAIQYIPRLRVPDLAVAQISPRSFATIRAAVEGANDSIQLRLQVDVEWTERPLRTLVAAIRGSEKPDECLVSAAHVQEPGANDNASGVGALLEGAVSLGEALKAGDIQWPKRSLVFVWGNEFEQTETWIKTTKRTPIAGISSDMVGNSLEHTGARALLERGPDPGALVPLAPDEHTPWGAGEVEADELEPNGLATVVRCAMVDVGIEAGGWDCADHPWEGGSDHDVFIKLKIPAVLLWHFTDFAYHTSLDRLDMVDAQELKRTEVVIFASMLALASPVAEDLGRYMQSVELERRVRVAAAREIGDSELQAEWETWCLGARGWLRWLCLGVPIDEALPGATAADESGAGE